MGIVLVRVDDRMVHGQIMEAWAPFCMATSIIVASDEAKKDRIRKIAIESCSSKALAIKVEGIEEALRDVTSEDMNKERVIIIFSTLKELLQACNKGFRVSHVNIGNMHHYNGKGRMITQSVYIDEEDEVILRSLLKLGIELDIRAVPSDKRIAYSG
ncbi:MAG: PTS sugar transporter subunit IIB [Deltaproteobacteria bacterium]|nr:PTS sugar transporter subunit IIB [Deltaproteobacteria bacterium]